MLILGQAFPVEKYILPLACGNFIYVAASDLLPLIREDSRPNDFSNLLHFCCMLIGVGLMALLLYLEHTLV